MKKALPAAFETAGKQPSREVPEPAVEGSRHGPVEPASAVIVCRSDQDTRFQRNVGWKKLVGRMTGWFERNGPEEAVKKMRAPSGSENRISLVT